MACTLWALRSDAFGQLCESDDGPMMRFVDDGPKFQRLYELWTGKLPTEPVFFNPTRDGWFRYAAIDWDTATTNPATLGIDLVRAYEMVKVRVPEEVRGWFARPIVEIDLEGELRLGFATDGELAPEVRDRWPHCTEQGLVYAVGTALQHFEALRPVVEFCQVDTLSARYANLRELLEALVKAGGKRRPPFSTRPSRDAMLAAEQGLGWLELDRPREALPRFERALQLDERRRTHYSTIEYATPLTHAIHACIDELRAALKRMGTTTWAEAEPRGRELEQNNLMRAAYELYVSVRDREAGGAQYKATRARCALAIDRASEAFTLAREVGDHAIAAEAAFRLRLYDDVLVETNGPRDERALLLRGKSLSILGRIAEARETLLRAPGLEALMLRRELDRKIIATRNETGTANAQTSPVPDDVRDLILADQLDQAIAILERGGDRLILGELYLRAGRAADALTTFESLDAIEALDGKARALRALGRISDADAVHELYEQHAARKSDLRVR